MADPVVLQPTPVFEADEITSPDVRVVPIPGLALASIAAGWGKGRALADRMQGVFGLAPPSGPTHVESGDVSVLGAGPGAWLAVSPDAALADRMSEALDGLGAVADQSGAYGVLSLEGPSARDLIARVVAIDLDPRAFPEDRAAILALGHLGGALWRLPGEHRFRLAVSRSTAADAWRQLKFAVDSLIACG